MSDVVFYMNSKFFFMDMILQNAQNPNSLCIADGSSQFGTVQWGLDLGRANTGVLSESVDIMDKLWLEMVDGW